MKFCFSEPIEDLSQDSDSNSGTEAETPEINTENPITNDNDEGDLIILQNDTLPYAPLFYVILELWA